MKTLKLVTDMDNPGLKKKQENFFYCHCQTIKYS